MDEAGIKNYLARINWDTPVSTDELYGILTGKNEPVGGIDKNWIYIRLLNSFNWYTVLKIIPPDEIPALLSDDVINKLFPRQLRNKYRHVRSALFE
jgi:hypothetical protein